MLGIRPVHATDAARCQLIDIRPRKERLNGLGFIAGSLNVPQTDDLEADAEAIDHLAGAKLPILVCLNGQRSRALVLALARALELPLGYLEGGVLGWTVAGLPLSGRGANVAPLPPLTVPEYQHLVRSELDALWSDVPTALRAPTRFVLERCAVGLGRPIEHWRPQELQHFPDLLAVVLLDLSVPRERVGTIIDRLVARMPALSSRPLSVH